MEKKRILVTTSSFPRFDLDHIPPFALYLSEFLSSYYEVTVIAPHSAQTPVREKLKSLIVLRFRYFIERYEVFSEKAIGPLLRRKPHYLALVPFFVFGQLYTLIKTIKRNNYFFVQAHWIIPQGLVAVIANSLLRRKIKIMIISHGGDIFGQRSSFARYLMQWTLRRSDIIVGVSSPIKRAIELLSDKKLKNCSVIPMGVDTRIFNPFTPRISMDEMYGLGGLILLYVGRLSEKKGIKYLISAMPEILSNHPKAGLLIVGDGELREELEEQVASLNLLDCSIVFAGSIANIHLPSYYASADVFISPSIVAKSGDMEGLPVTLMEAMSSGIPVVTTALEGTLDLIEDRESGVLVEPSNSALIAEKVSELLDSPETRKEIGLRARALIIESFSWEQIAKKYADLMEGKTYGI